MTRKARRRLHPIAIMAGLGKELKNMVVPLLVIMAAGSRHGFSWTDILVPLAALIYTLVMGVLSWLRFTYEWDDTCLVVEEGVFVRKKRSIWSCRVYGASMGSRAFVCVAACSVDRGAALSSGRLGAFLEAAVAPQRLVSANDRAFVKASRPIVGNRNDTVAKKKTVGDNLGFRHAGRHPLPCRGCG